MKQLSNVLFFCVLVSLPVLVLAEAASVSTPKPINVEDKASENNNVEDKSAEVSGVADTDENKSIVNMVAPSFDPVFVVEAAFGYIISAGTSNTRSANGNFHTERESRKHKHKFDMNALNSSTDGSTDAEQYYSELEFGKKMNEADLIIAQAKYEVDRFSSFDYQTSLSLGFKKRLYTNNDHWLDMSAGPGYRKAKVQDEKSDENIILSLGLDYQYPFNANTRFNEEIDVEAGEDNTSTRSESALSIQIAKRLALKLSAVVRFNSQESADSGTIDRTSSMTLVYTM